MVKDFSTRLEVIAIVLIYCLASSFCKQQVPQPNAAMCTTKCSSGSERILSRKRRALTFPEGSSLQLGMMWINISEVIQALVESLVPRLQTSENYTSD